MFIVPLVLAAFAFTLALIAIRRPETIRSSMRRRSSGIAPTKVREFIYDVAPSVYAAFGIVFGIVSLILGVTEIMSHSQ